MVRRNVFFGNNAGGFQANLDPEASLEEVMKHPSFRSYPPMEPTRAWAAGLMKLATDRFGENGFPDGRGVNFIIEQNVMNGNGRIGGGAINLAGLSDSLIQNNLRLRQLRPRDRAVGQREPVRPGLRGARPGALRSR